MLTLISFAVASVLVAARADDMALIPAGRFAMGSTVREASRDKVIPQIAEAERPQHEVTLRAFLMARHDVTRGEFARFVTETGYAPAPGCHVWYGLKSSMSATAGWRDPGFAQTDRDPVVCVSREDVDAYIAWRSRMTGIAYRLPSEAEWEYAARAATRGSRYWGDDPARQCAYANGASSTYSRTFPDVTDTNPACADGHVFTSPVGSFRPNPWGLYDMLGNVWQWTADCAHAYAEAPTSGDPRATGDCGRAVRRGGAWFDGPWLLRYATRKNGDIAGRDNGTGFRLARTLP